MGKKFFPAEADMEHINKETEPMETNFCDSNRSNGENRPDIKSSERVNGYPECNPETSLGTVSSLQSGPRPVMHHSATSPHLRERPHSANIPPVYGRILREIGDSYCYSPGIALRQMGDELSADYEVRRALSTGDIPNSCKNS